jgi:hypothetical protein
VPPILPLPRPVSRVVSGFHARVPTPGATAPVRTHLRTFGFLVCRRRQRRAADFGEADRWRRSIRPELRHFLAGPEKPSLLAGESSVPLPRLVFDFLPIPPTLATHVRIATYGGAPPIALTYRSHVPSAPNGFFPLPAQPRLRRARSASFFWPLCSHPPSGGPPFRGHSGRLGSTRC